MQPALVLSFLNRSYKSMNTTKLAREFKVCQGNMAKLLDKLEKIMLIKKQEGSNKREKVITLTKKGREIAKNISEIKEKLDQIII